MTADKQGCFNRILCAVDALSEDCVGANGKIAALVTSLISKAAREVESVFVLTPASAGVPSMIFAVSREELRQQAEIGLEIFSSQLGHSSKFRHCVLVDDRSSTRSGATALQDHAKVSGAQLMVLSTHARTGLDRWLIGSFTEAYLDRATIPTLTINPKCGEVGAFEHTLVPTDLSDESLAFIEAHANYFAQLGTKVTLFFHGYFNPILPFPNVVGQDFVSWQKLQESKLGGLVDKLVGLGVSAHYCLESQSGNTVDRILNHAGEHRTNLIAIESRWHPLAQSALGRIPRQLVRRASVPVLVFPSRGLNN